MVTHARRVIRCRVMSKSQFGVVADALGSEMHRDQGIVEDGETAEGEAMTEHEWRPDLRDVIHARDTEPQTQ